MDEFPAQQCICAEGKGGQYCEVDLCLNNCSGHGECSDGHCVCDMYFEGPDCSVMTFEPGRTAGETDELPP